MIIATNTSALHVMEFSSCIAAGTLPQTVRYRPMPEQLLVKRSTTLIV
ncbi:hypothetical protein [Polaromonas naphthalenivorans]|jgi:hypothetical protein|nr:hypothetical protein [Polaromonas naphthalenivorans]MDD4943139.1 hypothetical protein [Rhodoferax sp.]